MSTESILKRNIANDLARGDKYSAASNYGSLLAIQEVNRKLEAAKGGALMAEERRLNRKAAALERRELNQIRAEKIKARYEPQSNYASIFDSYFTTTVDMTPVKDYTKEEITEYERAKKAEYDRLALYKSLAPIRIMSYILSFILLVFIFLPWPNIKINFVWAIVYITEVITHAKTCKWIYGRNK